MFFLPKNGIDAEVVPAPTCRRPAPQAACAHFASAPTMTRARVRPAAPGRPSGFQFRTTLPSRWLGRPRVPGSPGFWAPADESRRSSSASARRRRRGRTCRCCSPFRQSCRAEKSGCRGAYRRCREATRGVNQAAKLGVRLAQARSRSPARRRAGAGCDDPPVRAWRRQLRRQPRRHGLGCSRAAEQRRALACCLTTRTTTTATSDIISSVPAAGMEVELGARRRRRWPPSRVGRCDRRCGAPSPASSPRAGASRASRATRAPRLQRGVSNKRVAGDADVFPRIQPGVATTAGHAGLGRPAMGIRGRRRRRRAAGKPLGARHGAAASAAARARRDGVPRGRPRRRARRRPRPQRRAVRAARAPRGCGGRPLAACEARLAERGVKLSEGCSRRSRAATAGVST